MTQEEQVRETIGLLFCDRNYCFAGCEHFNSIAGCNHPKLSRLLNLTYPSGQKMVGILDDDQSLPRSEEPSYKKPNAYEHAQEEMLKAGWRKTL